MHDKNDKIILNAVKTEPNSQKRKRAELRQDPDLPAPKRLRIINSSTSSSPEPEIAYASSSSSVVAVKPDPYPVASSHHMPDPLDLFASAALYNPAAVAEEPNDAMQVDEVPMYPINPEPVVQVVNLKKFSFELHRKPESEKFSKFKDLALKYINGVIDIDYSDAKRYVKVFMLAGILENKNLEVAKKFLNNFTHKVRQSLLKDATLDLISFGTKEAIDIALELGLRLLDLGDSSRGMNILHILVEIKDGAEKLNYIIGKIDQNTAIELALEESWNNKAPIAKVAEDGYDEAFNSLLTLILKLDLVKWRNPKTGSNILHLAVSARDNGKMLKRIIEELGKDASAKLALEINNSNSLSATPLLEASSCKNYNGFCELAALIPEAEFVQWRNPKTGSNILHHAALAFDEGKMLRHIVEKIGIDAAKNLAQQKNSRGDMPIINAAQCQYCFEMLADLTPNWKTILDSEGNNMLNRTIKQGRCESLEAVLNKLTDAEKAKMSNNSDLMNAVNHNRGPEIFDLVVAKLTPNWINNDVLVHQVLLQAKKYNDCYPYLYKHISKKYDCSLDGTILRIGNTIIAMTDPAPSLQQPSKQVVPGPASQPLESAAPQQTQAPNISSIAVRGAPVPSAVKQPSVPPLSSSSSSSLPVQQNASQASVSITALIGSLKDKIIAQVPINASAEMLIKLGELKSLYEQHLKGKQNSASSISK